MASMNKSELLKVMKNEAMARFDLSGSTQIGPSEYAIPVNGGYVTVTFTAKNPTGTDKVPAFSLEKAVEDYRFVCEERERKVAERLAKKLAKQAK